MIYRFLIKNSWVNLKENPVEEKTDWSSRSQMIILELVSTFSLEGD